MANVRALRSLTAISMVFVSVTASGQQIESPAKFWKAEPVFAASLKSRLGGLSPFFNLEAAVGITAIPVQKSPVSNMEQMESRPTTVGALYLPTGSVRLKLSPGAYRVEVVKEADGWHARFRDDKGKEQSRAVADVKPAEPVSVPFATVEYSICYRFDRTVVCV